MIKKYLVIILMLAILMLTVLTGCGSKDSQPEEDNRREQLIEELMQEYEENSEEDTTEDGENIDQNQETVDEDDEEIEVMAEAESEEPKNPLTGLSYDGEYKPVAMMIENSPAARPQSGLINADLVYEAHAEGGITRFMAIFLSETPEIVGPIRSVRHYYMHMAREWNALLVHYGQSFIAEEQFDTIQVHRLNGLYMPNEEPFWRDSSRNAPHNVYIDTKDCLEKIDFEQEERGFEFSTEPIEGEEYQTLILPYNQSYSMVEYRYDEENGLNMRYMNGKPHVDRETGDQLYNKNIIVQYAKHGILEPGAGYREVEVIGSGKAIYFIDGKYQEGTWKRQGANASTQYLDASGQPICLAPGKVWIEVVPENMEITIK